MQEKHQFRASPATVENPTLLEKLPMIKKCHIEKRLDCAKTNLQHCNDYLKQISWYDKSKNELFGHNDATHVWREDGAAYSQKNTISTMKHGGGRIMV